MFDKLQQGRDLIKLRQQAKQLQKQLEEIELTEEKGEIRVRVNGAQQVVYLEVGGVPRDDIVEVINKATKEVQKKAARKMLESGGGLSGLLGRM